MSVSDSAFSRVDPNSCPQMTATIDQIVAARQRAASVIKLDLEGSELSALRGAQHVLDRDRPTIITTYAVA